MIAEAFVGGEACLKRTLRGVVFAFVVGAGWPSSSIADVVELVTGEKIEGTVRGTTPRGLVIEVKGRERTIARRLVRGIVFGPTRRLTPSSSTSVPPAAVAAPAPASAEAATGGSTTTRTEPAALASPEPALTRAKPEPATPPEPAAPGVPPTERGLASKPAPEPVAGGESVAPGPAPPQAVVPVEPTPTPPAAPVAPAPVPPRPTIAGLTAPSPEATAATGDYQIGPEDLLDINVWNNTAISRTVPVRPDGRISLPLVNDVQVAGLTPMQLRDVLVKKLADYMPTPEVSVIVREVHSFKVSVLGEVKKPGQFELKSQTTVLDVIALAGGFTPFASPSHIVILRSNGTTSKRVPFNYKKVISSEPLRGDLFLQPGDIVMVP